MKPGLTDGIDYGLASPLSGAPRRIPNARQDAEQLVHVEGELYSEANGSGEAKTC